MTVASVPSVDRPARSVVIADDQPMSAAGLGHLLVEHGFEIAAVVDDVSSVIAAVDAQRPDLLVIELAMGDAAAMLATVATIVDRFATPVLAFTDDISLARLQAALENGCLGLVPKTVLTSDIVLAAIAVASRHRYVHQRALAVLVDGLRAAGPEPVTRSLTPRELDVLALIAGGQTNAAIADHLGISAATVKSHVENLLHKLEAADRAHAVSTAMRRNLLR